MTNLSLLVDNLSSSEVPFFEVNDMKCTEHIMVCLYKIRT
jgi:hypothetical protein